ncbi:MAG: hypothetical protein JNM13_16965 [Hyphomicrobiaceae bacterium]|nr:hypothetical protein [Hyphomicrobiaceae bacterium]
MARIATTISDAVGIRHGVTMMANTASDLERICDLFDRIAVRDGGTREVGGLWPSERTALIVDLTGLITAFQTLHKRPSIDGVIDRGGGTLRLMNQLAADPLPGPPVGLSAEVVPPPGNKVDEIDGGYWVAEPSSMPGTGMMRAINVPVKFKRLLVKAEGSAIKWFGVVIPASMLGSQGASPHIAFTPTPAQGNYYDSSYDQFTAWAQLWDDYTSVYGCQLAGAGVNQMLIIPFYKNAQAGDLGDFLSNWQEVISAVGTAAINRVDPLYLRDTFTFNRIYSTSFSNGYVTHQNFFNKAVGAADMTSVLFDLDGVAGGSMWRPAKGVIYLNRQAPQGTNPVAGRHWYVGSRWADFNKVYGGAQVTTHAMSRNHLLYPGLRQFCPA